MNRIVLFTASLCAISSGAFAQSMRYGATTPTSANSFGGIRQPAAPLNTGNRGSGTWSFGASTYSMTTPAIRATGSSPTPAAGWSFGGSTYATASVAPGPGSSATAGADTRPGAMTVPIVPWDTALMDLQGGVTNAASANRSYYVREEVDSFTAAPDLPVYGAPNPPVATRTVVGGQAVSVTPYSGTPISTQPIR